MGLTVGKERGERGEGALDALTLHKVWSFIAQFVNDIQVYSGTLIARSLCVAATSLWWPHCWVPT